MTASGCSRKCLVSNNYCENLPVFTKKDFESVINNNNVFNGLVQIKSIKECGCIDPSLQSQCFERFK